jgi:hypothetical protein
VDGQAAGKWPHFPHGSRRAGRLLCAYCGALPAEADDGHPAGRGGGGQRGGAGRGGGRAEADQDSPDAAMEGLAVLVGHLARGPDCRTTLDERRRGCRTARDHAGARGGNLDINRETRNKKILKLRVFG